MLYIIQSTDKVPVWQVEDMGTHLGEGMKQHKGKQELFTFSNSVAFNISIYRQTLYMYRLQRDLNECRIQKSLYNSLDKCLQVAELSSFTKKMPDTDYGESVGM